MSTASNASAREWVGDDDKIFDPLLRASGKASLSRFARPGNPLMPFQLCVLCVTASVLRNVPTRCRVAWIRSWSVPTGLNRGDFLRGVEGVASLSQAGTGAIR